VSALASSQAAALGYCEICARFFFLFGIEKYYIYTMFVKLVIPRKLPEWLE